MCELLALSTSNAARLTFSLSTLAMHGGAFGTTHDGWGVAFYEGKDVAVFREPAAASGSPLVHYLEEQGPATTMAISHIRHATQGSIRLANTQPFARELGGRMHVFAHNGNMPDIYRSRALALASFRPVGESDSEHAFCALLERLRTLWAGDAVPSLNARRLLIAQFAAELREQGPANFLYSDADALFAHGDRRLQLPSHHVTAPGLWWLHRECAASNQSEAGISIESPSASLLVASVPLTDDPWQQLGAGELLVARAGRVVTYTTDELRVQR